MLSRPPAGGLVILSFCHRSPGGRISTPFVRVFGALCVMTEPVGPVTALWGAARHNLLDFQDKAGMTERAAPAGLSSAFSGEFSLVFGNTEKNDRMTE